MLIATDVYDPVSVSGGPPVVLTFAGSIFGASSDATVTT
jgi:hypothetical protein